jgi:ABC-type glycerol-3-phosphate transport system permease component
MGAYSLEKLRPAGHEVIFKTIIVGLMFVPPVAQIPIYIVMSKLHLLDTYAALILPSLASPMYLFLMKQFMSQVPDAMIESARIDGASEIRIFFQIVMPSTVPAWCTVIVFSFCAQWNNSGNSIIYITNQSMKTLPYVLESIGSGSASQVGAQAAAALLTTSVTIIIYTIMQKNVLKTMSYAGIEN